MVSRWIILKDMSTLMVAAGEVIAQAFMKACQVAKDLAAQSIQTALDMESAFAKVDSIASYSADAETAVGQSTEGMRKAIVELSNQYGISTADIGDSIYGMISATGDTAHAVENVEQATKLATAGFSDASSAASILATAMNAYGDSAGSVQDISDSLIATQNLGVTTVGELASQMGKAIATGSSYGVSLGNIEAAYVALTKNGIATAEATTYMSGMMNELGKAGTAVSDIIIEKTGKSFGQLMADGYNLNDVLEILYESVDGDAEALANLWSSQEAGKASSAIVSQGLEEFDGWLKEIENSSGATETAFETMSDTSQFKIDALKTTLQNMLGEAAEPVTERIGEFASQVTEWLDSIDMEAVQQKISDVLDKVEALITFMEEHKALIEVIATAIGILTTAIIAYNAVQAINQGLQTAKIALNLSESASLWALAAAELAALAPYVLIVAAIVGVIAVIVLLIKHWDQIKQKVTEVVNSIKSKVEEMKNKVTQVFDNVKSHVQGVVDFLKGIFNFEWKLPDIKLPHFSLTGEFSLKPPSVPTLSVNW